MLTHLQIKNFAIVEQLEIEFNHGLSVITGETGAGKSILIDALDLTLGGRADNNLIRHGTDRCEITASFSLEKIPLATEWLQQHELAVDQECILRRVIALDGRSKSTINGTPCPLQMLRELGSLLINIHGQHEHQSLMKREKQRDLLDDFAGHASLCIQVKNFYQEWRKLNDEREQLLGQTKDQNARIELLRYHVQELKQLNLADDEIKSLDQEQKKLANAEQLISSSSAALNKISEDENSILYQLQTTLHQLQSTRHLDNKIENAAKLLQDGIIQIEEAGNELQSYVDDFEIDEERLKFVEERLSNIHQLARKHHVHPSELAQLLPNYENQLEQLEHAEEHLQRIAKKITAIENEYKKIAKQLTQKRQQAAEKLSKLVSEKIHLLGLQGGKLQAQLEAIDEITPHGCEKIEFLISLNPGQPLQALNKVASGGELSRIGLAIQVIIAQKENTPTMVFDEVDVGIGGGTAEIVGKLLRQLGNTAQVLCITHLPQVAAQGHHHLQVKKQVIADSTHTNILPLSTDERTDEIARMLGGVKITEQTRAHAKEMLNISN